MTALGLRYARGHLLFGEDGSTAALYRLATTTYPYLSVSAKWAIQGQLERLVGAAGADFSLWRASRAYPVERYRPGLVDAVDTRGQDRAAWEDFLSSHEPALSALSSHTPEVYLAVRLRADDGGRGLAQSLLAGSDRVRAITRSVGSGGRHRPIAAGQVRRLALAEERLFDRLRGAVSLRRATTRELQWLLRRGAVRDVAEPRLERFWEPDALVLKSEDGRVVYEPLESDVWRLAREPMREDPHAPPTVRVEHEDGETFQAFCCVGSLAEEPTFPGPAAELLHAPLESVGFPVDAAVHARWLGNRDALAQVRKRVVDVEQVYRDQLESRNGPGWMADEDRDLAREYEADLQSGSRPPMLYATLSLAVSADTQEECDRRVGILRERFGDVELHRPRGLQEALFFDHLPRPDCGRVREYVQHVTPEQFGAMVPTATNEVGDPDGLYVGWTTTGAPRPVRFDITEAARTDRNTGVVLSGAVGSGKTLSALSIAYGAERRGSVVVDFDPRPDHYWERLPELAGRVETIELSGSEEHRGKLDPLAIAPADLREDLASSYLLDLLRDPPASWEHAIGRAVRDVVRQGRQSSRAVIDRLGELDTDAARDVADALDVVSDFGLGRLGFGNGRAEVGAASSVTTVRMPGLTLPDPATPRESYSRTERVSVATLSLVATLTVRMVMTDRTRHKVVLLDEAWFLLASSQGRSLLNRLIRLARGYNASVLLLTHRLGDLGELSELIGSWFVFRQDGDDEAKAALAQIGVDPTDAQVAALREAGRSGHCLMGDLHGRVASVQFDPGEHLLGALSTTPQDAADAEAVIA